MTTAYTTLLGLALPVQGELQGTWGDEVNNYITNYLDAAVAGTQTISGSQTAVTLSKTTGSSLSQAGSGATGSSQYLVINCTGNPAGTLTITAPAASKAYLIINATSTTQDVKIVGAGPTTGVTLVSGERAIVSWNGSDFVKVANFGGVGSFTTISATTGNITTVNSTTVDTTNLEVTNIKAKDGTASASIADSTGAFTVSAAFAANGNTTLGDAVGDLVTVNGTTTFANANPTLSAGTANGVLYLNGSKVATSGSALTFDGTGLGVGGAPSAARVYARTAAATGTAFQSDNSVNTGFVVRFEPNTTLFGNDFNQPLAFLQNNTEQMRLTSTGLGIGTSSPASRLDVQSASTANAYRVANFYNSAATSTTAGSNILLRVASNGSGADATLVLTDSTATNGFISNNNGNLLFGNGLGFVERMRLDASGNLGLGVTPSAWNSTWRASEIQRAGNAVTSNAVNSIGLSSNAYFDSVGWKYGANGAANFMAVGNGGGQFAWFTAPSGTAGNAISFTQAMTLDASGNLLVGTTAASWGSSGRGLIEANGTSTFLYGGKVNGTQTGYFAGSSSVVELAAVANVPLAFLTNGSEKMRLDASGNLGLGVTPSAWNADYKAIQVGANGSIAGRVGTSNSFDVSTNTYRDNVTGDWRYIASSGVSRYSLDGSTSAHIWYTAPSGTAGNAISFTQAMTLDASGNLGVGVTSVSSSQSASAKVIGICDPTTTNLSSLRLSSGATFSSGTRMEVFATGAYNAIWGETNHALVFATNNTERARITSGGDLLVGGQTSATTIGGRGSKINAQQAAATAEWAGAFIHPATTGTNAFGVGIRYSASSPNSASNPFLYIEDSTAVRARIDSNGGFANYQANDANLSDRREKTNFAPAKSYLDTICAIPVQTFNYVDQNLEDDPGLTLGVVAQDVQAVAPELVMESNWGTEDNPKMRLSIYQTDLQYALMKCVQELKAELDATKARLAALEAQP